MCFRTSDCTLVSERVRTRTGRGTALAKYSGNAEVANDENPSTMGDRGRGHKKIKYCVPCATRG